MASRTDSLPDDIAELRTFAMNMLAERDAAIAERDRALTQNARLAHLLKQYARARFGRSSERLDPDQLQLGLEDLEQALGKHEAQDDKTDAKAKSERARTRRANRGSLPAHLPRVHVTVAPQDTSCPCCNGAMHAIGEDTSERLDVIPAQYKVIVTHRPIFACRACEGSVVQEPAAARLIEGGIPTEAMVAHVLVSKYGWHLPLYRQSQILKSQGIAIDRSTLAFWVGYAACELMPVHDRMRQILLTSAKLAVDETPVPVLDPGRGKTKTGYFWAIARDDRPWAGKDPPAVVYSYAPSRTAEHAASLLATYRGIVQCDGYSAYKKLSAERIALAFCWAHVRRKFYDIAKAGSAPIASEALERIAALYRIETAIRGQSAEQRCAMRQEQSKPLVAAFKDWLEARLRDVSAKSPIAVAIRYSLNHWDGLTRFLDDGRIELDTNIVERSMRPIALNRKNALFAGHDDGAANWAVIASLVETCKLHNIDPQAYIADVLTRLVNLWPQSRLDELMPWAWAAAGDAELRAAA